MAPPASRLLTTAMAALALALGAGAAPAAAQSKVCPQVTPPYTGPCGPTFVLPGWGDAGGWTNPEQYETIQLADVDGDGADELLARTPAGLAVHVFDKTLGQWRPQVDSSNLPVILTEFANPPPLTSDRPNPPRTDWTLPQYYDTIQAANIDGPAGEEIIARSADGMIVFKFTPSGRGQGSWRQLSTSGPLADPDWAAASSYTTIQTGDFDGSGGAELFARGSQDIAMFWWDEGNATWNGWNSVDFLTNADNANEPAYYTSLQVARLGGTRQEMLVGRELSGISAYRLRSFGTTPISRFSHPFSDNLLAQDCPFATGTQTCFGTGPAYYETIQFADIDGDGRDELVGRASDGLRVRRYEGDVPGGWRTLPTLTDLSDANGYTKQQYWETIQTADITGDRRAEVVARDKDGLNVWSYNPASKGWTKLTPSTGLALADDPWGSDRSYYSTIQTGDVDGDGHDDVVARGPYGIRTWFYNRRGSGGWESYRPYGYEDFLPDGPEDVAAGRKAAFDALNSRAKAQGVIPDSATTVRDVWASLDAPSADRLDRLQTGIVQVGACTGSTSPVPPQYGTCTPPSGSPDFTAADWTAVVNQILAELFWAEQVVDHFDEIGAIKEALFLEEGAQLPQIGKDLALADAAGAEAEFDIKEIFGGMMGIAGAIAGEGPLGLGLEIAAELLSMLPSASPTLSGPPFEATYDEFTKSFADSIAEVDKALAEHSELVRQDAGLLTLLGQLHQRGTWTTPSGSLGKTGMESVGRQGWTLSVYKTLLPTLWARYVITNCQSTSKIGCEAPPSGAWMQGMSASFTGIGPVPTPEQGGYGGSPCDRNLVIRHGAEWICTFVAPKAATANLLWGQISGECAFDGENASTAWLFGCNLGVDPAETLRDPADPSKASASQGWDFKTYTGSPVVSVGSAGDVTGSVAGVGDAAMLRMRGRVALPRALRLRRASVRLDRLLFEPGGGGELMRARTGRRLAALRLSRERATARQGVFASQRRARPRLRLRLTGPRRRELSFALAARNVAMPRPPIACSGTRPGVDRATEPIRLHTRLLVDDGGRGPLAISLNLLWQCRADRLGAVKRLVIRPPAHPRPSERRLAVSVRGPRRVRPGRTVTYTMNVRNGRRTSARDVLVRAILPNALEPRRPRRAHVYGGQVVVWRLPALAPGRSRTFRLRVRVTRSAAGANCPVLTAWAIDTPLSRSRTCTRVARVWSRPQLSR